jgi:hypothetical protein
MVVPMIREQKLGQHIGIGLFTQVKSFIGHHALPYIQRHLENKIEKRRKA